MKITSEGLRVLHYMRGFSPLSQTFVYDYLCELERQGVEVHVLAQVRENAGERPFARVSLARIPGRWHPRRLSRKLLTAMRRTAPPDYTWAFQREAAEAELRRVRPDVVHAHFGPAGALIAPVARKLGIPVVVSFYGYDASQLLRDPYWRGEYAKLWEVATFILVLSQEMRERVRDAGCPAEKCEVVHLAKDLSAYPSWEVRFPVRRLVSVGRLVEKKGHADLIGAFKLLVRDHPGISLTIIGDGPLRSGLEELIRQHDLGSHVRLAGALQHATVMEALRSADAFVLCSKTSRDGDQEGTPTVLLEAQAVGLPCVSTHHAGIPEMVPPENHGLLARPGDVDSIEACLRRLLTATPDELARVARRGREKVEGEYDLTVEAGKLARLYVDASIGEYQHAGL